MFSYNFQQKLLQLHPAYRKICDCDFNIKTFVGQQIVPVKWIKSKSQNLGY